MYSCAKCNNSYNDGAQCGMCEKKFDFGCAGITEIGYRKLGVDRRAAWRCPSCKNVGSPSPKVQPTSSEGVCSGPSSATSPVPVSLETIFSELQVVKSHLSGLPALQQDVRSIKQELVELRTSCEFSGKTLDEHSKRIADVETKMSDFAKSREDINTALKEVASLRQELEAKDQWYRMNNVEIKGVPVKPNENLYSIAEAIGKGVSYVFPKTQINYIARVPTYNSNEKSIIISFLNRYVKEDFIAAARATKSLFTETLNIPNLSGSNKKIFVNDHLTPLAKQLLTKAKKLAGDKDYSYVWVKYGKIHVRKNDTSKVFIIATENDLNKIV